MNFLTKNPNLKKKKLLEGGSKVSEFFYLDSKSKIKTKNWVRVGGEEVAGGGGGGGAVVSFLFY